MRTSNVTYLVKKGISSIWKNFLMSFASFCILMVSLLLVSCAVLLMMNVNKIMSNIEDTNEITIYLKEDISDKQVEHIKSVLEKNQDITDVKYYSKEQALDDFRDNMAEYSELLDYLDNARDIPRARKGSFENPTCCKHRQRHRGRRTDQGPL